MAGKKTIVLQTAPKSNNNNKKKNNNSKKESAFTTPNKPPKQLNLNAVGLTPDANKYKQGLLNPFSDAAIGARLPDQYFAPTVTYAVREFLTVKVEANGEFDIVICPNPIYVAYSTRNSITNGSTMTMKDSTTYANAQYVNSLTSLASKVSNYRIVNWGIRVRQTQSINTTQGTLTAALFVPKDGLYHPTIGTSGAPVGNQSLASGNWNTSTIGTYLLAAGLPATGSGTSGKIDIGSLVDFPYHMRASCVNCAENTYEIAPKLVSPTSQHFRGSYDTVFGTDITGQNSVAFVQPGDASYVLVDGWTNIVLSGSGLAANSAGAVDIEVVYNIEGNPQLVLSGTSAIAVATGAKSAHDPLGMLLAQSALDSAPAFKLLNLARVAFKAFGTN
jgi:hypothetical protein